MKIRVSYFSLVSLMKNNFSPVKKFFINHFEPLIYDTITFHFISYCNTQSLMNTILISILICLIASGGNPCFYSPPTSHESHKICSDVTVTIIENDDKNK